MKPADLRTWYEAQSPRDQRVLWIGAVVVGLILLAWIFIPLQRSLGAAREQVRQQQDDLEWMRRYAPSLAAAGPGPGATATQEPLVVLVDRSARETGLGQALTGSVPAGNGAMRVQFERADFNLLLGWVARLSSQNGVRVEAATVTAAGSPGIVDASVQLHADH